MAGHLPPHRSDYETDAHWGEARAIWFKNHRKPKKPPEPVIIEKPVEVERIVEREVEKIVYVDRPVQVPQETIDRMVKVKAALDNAGVKEPSEAFLSLQEPGETVEQTRMRLSDRFDELQARVANDAATPEQQAEYTFLYGIYFELKAKK